MFKNHFYLIFPVQGDVATASSFKIDDDFIVYDSINFQTRDYVKTEWLHKSLVHKVVRYDSWNAFQNAVNKLLTAVAEAKQVQGLAVKKGKK